MSTKAAVKPTGANKKPAAAKTTGLSAADLTPKKKHPSKLFFLGTGDKYSICSDVVGTTEYKIITFLLSGVLPSEGGFLCTLDEDGHTVKWSRPVDAFLFSMGHLRGIMGEEDYSESHVRVRSFDDVLQSMSHDKVEADAADKYWNPRVEDPCQMYDAMCSFIKVEGTIIGSHRQMAAIIARKASASAARSDPNSHS